MIFIGNALHAVDYILVAAIVCALSSWAAFHAIEKTRKGSISCRGACITIAVSAGLGVWSTHFIAMLGLRPDFIISYSLVETVASLLIAIIFVGGAMTWTAVQDSQKRRAIGAGVSSGAVSVMHHVGMTGLSGCIVNFEPLVVAIVTIAIFGFFFAAQEVAKRAVYFANVKAAAIMTTGVVILHFGSIAGTSITIGPDKNQVLSPDMLETLQIIALLVLLIPIFKIASGAFLTYREIQLSSYVAMATGEGIVSTDANGEILWVNSAFEALSGMNAGDFVGQSGTSFVKSLAKPEQIERYEKALETGTSVELILKSYRPNGENYWQNVRLLPRHSADGKLLGFVSAHRDVTPEVLARKNLQQSEAEARRLALVARHTTDSVLISDADGQTIWVNDAFVRLSGYEKHEIIGQKPGDVLQGADTSVDTQVQIAKALHDRKSIRCELLNYTKLGKPYWIELDIAPVQQDPDPLRFVAVSRDISQRIKREKRLIKERARAQAADQMKSEFLAKMSHEIRTPMNGVTGMAELLSMTKMDELQTSYLDHIRSSSDRLLRVVDDILDFSLVEEGRVTLSIEPFCMLSLLDETMNVVRNRAALKNIELSLTVRDDVPGTVLGDHGRLQQVILNLLTNAIKFTDEGSVQLRVSKLALDNDGDQGVAAVEFAIVDTGIGIPPAQQATVFDRFTQVDGSTRRLNEGIGLGLSIATGLVEAMGGEIRLTSELGKGSTFAFNITFETAADRSVRPMASMAGR